MKNHKSRLIYAGLFVFLVAVEVAIALWVHDSFVRPYLGDVIVVVVLWAAVRAVFPRGLRLLPLWLFLFAMAVEAGQYFDLVDRIGLGKIPFFRVLIGTSFSHTDLLCYAAGALICAGAEAVIHISSRKDRK